MNTMQKYQVTRQFTDGPLKGMTHTEVSVVGFPVGFKCDKPVGGSPYVILACTEVQ